MAFVIAFETGFVQFMSYGPIYQSVPSDLSKVCKDFGWRNFLYIQNFFKTEKMVSSILIFDISCQKHDYLSNSSVWGKLGT